MTQHTQTDNTLLNNRRVKNACSNKKIKHMQNGLIFRSARSIVALMTLFLCALLIHPVIAQWQTVSDGQQIVELASDPRALAIDEVAKLAVIAHQDSQVVSLVDLAQGQTITEIPLNHPSPNAVALAAASNTAYIAHDNGFVSVIDTAAPQLMSAWNLNGSLKDIILLPDGETLMVAAYSPRRLLWVNRADGVILNTVSLDHRISTLALDSSGMRILAGSNTEGLLIYDTNSTALLGAVALPDKVKQIAWWESGERAVVATNNEQLHLIDIDNFVISQQVPLTHKAFGLAIHPDTDTVYIGNREIWAVEAVNLNDSSISSTILLPHRPDDVRLDVMSNQVYATLFVEGQLVRQDLTAPVSSNAINLGYRLQDIALNESANQAVVVGGLNQLSLIALNDRSTTTIDLPISPYKLAVDDGRQLAVIAADDEPSVLRFMDLATQSLLSNSIDFPFGIHKIAIDSQNGIAAIISANKQTVHILNLDSLTLIGELNADGPLKDVAMHSGRNTAYFIHRNPSNSEHTLQAIDLSVANNAFAFSSVLTVANKSKRLAINEENDTVIIAAQQSDLVQIIDLNTNQVTTEQIFDAKPSAIAINTSTQLAVIASKSTNQLAYFRLVDQVLTQNTESLNSPRRLIISETNNQALVMTARPGEIVFVDLPSTAPALTFTNPAQNSVVSTLTPLITLNYSDEQNDVDTNTLALQLNGDALTVTCSFEVSGNDGTANCTPTQPLVEGAAALTATIADTEGNLSDEALVDFTIELNNQPPSFISAPITAAIENAEYRYTAQATDPDNDELTYSLTQAPDVSAGVMQINASTGEVVWLPTSTGTFNVTIAVTDGEHNVEQSYAIVVAADQSNQPPAFTSTPITTAIIDEEYNYFAQAQDPDSDDTLSYSLIDAPLGMHIDSVTGDIRWTPIAINTAAVTVNVSDGEANITQVFTVAVDYDPSNLPPTLAPIADQTIAMGNQVAFQITGADPEGLAITYSAAPLPLIAGASFNANTGAFVFEPSLGQAGSHVIVFSINDGRFTTSQAVTLTVTDVDPQAPTTFSGRLLDGTAMEQGNVLPLRRATVSFLGTGVQTLSDEDGYFTLNDIPLVEGILPVFAIDSSTADDAPGGAKYASFREALHLIPHADNVEPRAFTLPRNAEASVTQVNPTTTTLVENTALGVSMEVPPFTALTETGAQFTGQISISEVPPELAPASMPEFVDPGLLITIQPSGLEFATLLAVTFPNVDQLAPGAEVDLWSVDPAIGAFQIVGTGRVTADGLWIETVSGGFPRASWGFPAPQPPADPEPESDPDNPDQDCEKTGSWTCLNDGKMTNQFRLPVYRSLEADRSWSFIYQTSRAEPRPILSFSTSSGANMPNTISASLSVGGNKQGREVFFSTENLTANRDIRMGLSFNAAHLDSGIYPVRITTASYFNASILRSFASTEVQVINEQESPFGSGWMLGVLSKLVLNVDGSVLCIMPGGRHIIYRPDTIDGEFITPAGNFSTLVRNADSSFTLTDQYGNQDNYDNRGIKTAMQDRNGNQTNFAYDGSDRLITITDPVGLQTQFAYSNGRMTHVTDPAQRVTQFEHDSLGNLTAVIYPDNSRVTYDYEGNLMTARTDERDNLTRYQYDGFGRNNRVVLPDNTVRDIRNQSGIGLLAVDGSGGTGMGNEIGTANNPSPFFATDEATAIFVDARGNPTNKLLDDHSRSTMTIDEVGRVYEYVRNADSLALETTRPNGSKTSRTFDVLGNTLTITEDFNNAVHTYEYDNFSLPLLYTNPNGNSTTYNRDAANGNITSILNELGHTTTYTYDSRGLVQTLLEPNGLLANYEYNDQGLIERVTVTPPNGSAGNVRITTYTYFNSGLVETLTTPDGITYIYSYDERSRILGYVDNLGQRMVISYDLFGNIVSVENLNADGSAALQTAFDFDSRNRAVGSRKPHELGESIYQTLLDPNSNRIGSIDANNQSSTYEYDASNRVASFTHRLNGVTRYTYDTNDRIISVTAPNSVVTLYQYDLLGRRTLEISPDRGRISYNNYDLANNLLQSTDARGISKTYQYDRLERLTNINYPNNNENVIYSYDSCSFGVGYLCAIDDESGSYSYAYDAFGNVVQMNKIELGQSYTTSYAYDNGNNVIAMTLPSGRDINYQRDGVRRVAGITAVVNSSTQNIVSNVQYRADNQMTQCTFGNGLVDDRQYDLQGRLGLQSLGAIDNRNYSYDANSNMLSRNTTPQSSVYQYDALDRLTSDKIDTADPLAFSYDLNHNRLEQTQASNLAENYRYTQSSNRLSVVERLEVGNTTPIDEPDQLRVYNDANRWFELYKDGALTARYIYNSLGQRTRKVIENTDGSQATIIYHYNLAGQLISETTEAGQAIKDYVWHGMSPVAQIEAGSTENIYYLHTDHLFTPRIASNNTGSMVWRWEGEAFGEADAQSDVDGNGVLAEINLRFPGQYYDAETQMHYNYFRNYDPRVGRYGQSDRIGLGGGSNTYSYVKGNPINWSDPFGLLPQYWYQKNQYGQNWQPTDAFARDAHQDGAEIFKSLGKGVEGLGIALKSPILTEVGGGIDKLGDFLDHTTPKPDGDNDNDGLPDFLDLDDDNDGMPDTDDDRPDHWDPKKPDDRPDSGDPSDCP